MRIRPARATRTANSQAWARYSVKKPRKNYIKALPHTSLLIFKMGTSKEGYDITFRLNAKQRMQVRSNALEAARQAANKYLEKEAPGNYLLTVVTYPHVVLREKRMAQGAGADRISQGMSLAFGTPAAIAARIYEGQTVFELRTSSSNKGVAYEAMKRAASKLSGTYRIVSEMGRKAETADAKTAGAEAAA